MANSATLAQPAIRDTDGKPAAAFAPLTAVATGPWRELAARAIEPNGYYLPEWALAVSGSARGRTGASALSAWSDPAAAHPGAARLIGLMPVVSLWRAYAIPLPALVSAHPYGTLCTPLIDGSSRRDSVRRLMTAARAAGAHALILREMAIDGAAMRALADALREDGLCPRLLRSHRRACLDASRDGDEVLREALGARKLKELRRQRHRLADQGAVAFEVAQTPQAVEAAIEGFLTLEASGWKGRRGTALAQHPGDAAFVRSASVALAAHGQCEVVTLRAGTIAVAAAIVLRHQHRAFYFKLGVDERFARLSPGVQLTLELTRHLCDDPAIQSADSMASADHPMINPIWRGRFEIGDVLIPLRPRDPMVAMISTAIRLRGSFHDGARGALRLIRHHRGTK